MTSKSNILNLFEGYGVELEYMIVRKDNLAINPIADKVLFDIAGIETNEYCDGLIGWSNELALHVLEFKNVEPEPSLQSLPELFLKEIKRASAILDKYDSMLLPTGSHPFMDPHKETHLWECEYTEIYHAYDRIFNCEGHGWSNLQSTHLNLPFNGDEQFGRLHAAIRIVLPLIPAIAASTPILENAFTGLADTRLEYYRKNQRNIPSIAGAVIPEQVFSIDEYHSKILSKIYRDITPHDPDKILQEEWLNSRGAIARFDRNAIEIRLIDIQETPRADIILIEILVKLLKGFTDEIFCSYKDQKLIHESELVEILLNAIKNGSNTVISNESFLKLYQQCVPCSVSDLIILALEKNTDEQQLATFKNFIDTRTISDTLINKYDQSVNEGISKFIDKEYRQLADSLISGTLYR